MIEPSYTIAICKGAALTQETRELLKLWRPGTDPRKLAEAALQHGSLGNRSAYRINDIVNRVFVRRLLRPDDLPARTLLAVIQAGMGNEVFNELALLYAGRTDALLADFTSTVYWGAVAMGRSHLRIEDALTFIDDAVTAGRIDEAWSEQVRVKIARGLLGALRDFGFVAQKLDRGRRRLITKTRVSDWTVAIVAREHGARGLSAGEMLHSQDWAVLGLRPLAVAERLESFAPRIGAVVQRAGETVNVTWEDASVEEMIGNAA